MAFETHRDCFDDADRLLGARALEGPANRFEDREHVHAVDAVPFDAAAVGGCPQCERGDRVLEPTRCTERPLVVLDHDDKRKPQHRRDVQRLMEVSSARLPLADEHEHRVVGPLIPLGERAPRPDRRQRAQVTDQPGDAVRPTAHVQAAVPAVRESRHPPARLRHQLRGGNATHHVRAEIPNRQGHPVGVPQRVRRSDGRGLVARAHQVLAEGDRLAG